MFFISSFDGFSSVSGCYGNFRFVFSSDGLVVIFVSYFGFMSDSSSHSGLLFLDNSGIFGGWVSNSFYRLVFIFVIVTRGSSGVFVRSSVRSFHGGFVVGVVNWSGRVFYGFNVVMVRTGFVSLVRGNIVCNSLSTGSVRRGLRVWIIRWHITIIDIL